MSLKGFHLIFINTAILLLCGFAYWGTQLVPEASRSSYAFMSAFSILLACALVFYECFLEKLLRR